MFKNKSQKNSKHDNFRTYLYDWLKYLLYVEQIRLFLLSQIQLYLTVISLAQILYSLIILKISDKYGYFRVNIKCHAFITVLPAF